MNINQNSREIWIGRVEVRPIEKGTVLDDAKGAFVNIVTWASTSEEYRINIELILAKLHLILVDIVNPEPVQRRRSREGDFDEAIEDMIDRAQNNPRAIIYGTFHLWEKDDA